MSHHGKYVPGICAVINDAFPRGIHVQRKYIIKWYNMSHYMSCMIFVRVTKNCMIAENSETVI